MTPCFNVIDLFAGPGGLGEGFSSYEGCVNFNISLSVEMDKYACETLRGRRIFEVASQYGDNCILANLEARQADGSLRNKMSFEQISGSSLWNDVNQRVLQATLGEHESNIEVRTRIARLRSDDKLVLIGGPPCQAYSLAGRSRNRQNPNYDAAGDKRNFLYREYLRQVVNVAPAVFVMENVKGLLSAKVDGVSIVDAVIADLEHPVDFVTGEKGPRYKLYSIVRGENNGSLSPRDYVVEAEAYGVPQARHRVILLGVREDIDRKPRLLERSIRKTVSDAISDLPKICAGTTDIERTSSQIGGLLVDFAMRLRDSAKRQDDQDLAEFFDVLLASPEGFHNQLILPSASYRAVGLHNHESRNHMPSDLYRYLYVSAYANVRGRSPKGPVEFIYPGLAPNHKNWKTGKFADRFKCQIWDMPSSTITSHSGKDGHYFIHPDPFQCRSLTVREAARLQTFPDNYFFEGPRSSQFQQVGNAVPVALARQIAAIVADLLS